MTKNLDIWLCQIDYPHKFKRKHLETAEKIFVYFWQPHLNIRKKISIPEETTVISYWFSRDRKPRINQNKLYKELPDVISWDGSIWRIGNLSVVRVY